MSITQKCSYDTCEYKQATKYRTTYCSAHYWREKESRDMSKPIIVSRKGMTAYERVMCQVEERGDCLIFTGYKMKNGYGTVTSLGGDRKILAHRAVIQHHRGESDLNVLHSCDTPSCVNIEHLRYGTQKDNMKDAMQRGRTTRGKRNSMAKLTEDEVISIYADTRPYKDIAKAFNSTVKNVGNIKLGVSWNWLTKHN